MFLKCYPNPHQAGRMTRALVMRGQTECKYAIDAETLHKSPQLLNTLHPHMRVWIKLLDGLAYAICIAGFIASWLAVWWLFAPGIVACVMMLATNRKTAGEIARRAAIRSVDAFRNLHEMGVMWIVPA